ncbi:MAG: hypothetical protein HRU25_07430 [Psychrobium sp.]|nr:hypothetical protein [Psychrobium sp.]
MPLMTHTQTLSIPAMSEKSVLTTLGHMFDGVKLDLLKLIAVSLLIQSTVIMTTLYMEYLVDVVSAYSKSSMIIVLMFAYTLLCIAFLFVSLIRAKLLTKFSLLLNHLAKGSADKTLQKSQRTNVCVGQLALRFESMKHVLHRLTHCSVEFAVDVIISIVLLVLMFSYSVNLSMIFVILVLCSLLTKNVVSRVVPATSTCSGQALGALQVSSLEDAKTARSSTFNRLLFIIEGIAVLYIASMMILNSEISLGMALAFIAFKGQLMLSLCNVMDQITELNLCNRG